MPAASASVTAANTHSAPVRRGRSAGSTGRNSSAAPPTPNATRREHARAAERPAERDRDTVTGAPAVPTTVEDEAHEYAAGNQRQAEHVALALVEHRQTR